MTLDKLNQIYPVRYTAFIVSVLGFFCHFGSGKFLEFFGLVFYQIRKHPVAHIYHRLII